MNAQLMQLLAETPTNEDQKPELSGSARFSRPSSGRGVDLYLYLTVYLFLEWASQFHSFGFVDIALWNPSPAASLILLLARGLTYAPLLFMAGLLSTVFVHDNPHSFVGTIASSALMAAGYTALAAALRRAKFQVGRGAMRDVAALLVLTPVGALFGAVLACGALFLAGDMPRESVVTALTHSWVGDTLGILIMLPAITALMILSRRGLEKGWGAIWIDIGVYCAGLGVALWCMFGLADTKDHQFFYLLFLPVIWVAVRNGFPGAALAILFSQLSLLTVTETVDYDAGQLIGLQMLMLALAATGHLLGSSVTERLQSEDLGKVQQAELARMARNTTAGAMGVALAHQISQPLSTVATHIHVALRQVAARDGETGEIVESLKIATAEMRRAQDVLGHLREFISHGKAEMASVDLSALVIRLAEVLRAEVGRKQVRFSFDLAVTPAVTADVIQIEQVVLNLVTNAAEAAAEREDGRGRVLVRTSAEDGSARIIVEDNGAGLAPDIAERLYEPFVTSKESGMGLGLALSRQIVALHGSRMWWESIQPEGTRFVVELPLRKEA
jgi:two-component system, LuxR family, sensor kinase FixL